MTNTDSAYYRPRSVSKALCLLTQLSLTTTLSGGCYCFRHLTDKETEAQVVKHVPKFTELASGNPRFQLQCPSVKVFPLSLDLVPLGLAGAPSFFGDTSISSSSSNFLRGVMFLFFSTFLKSSVDFILVNMVSMVGLTPPVVPLQPTFNHSPSPSPPAWPCFQKLVTPSRARCDSFHTGPRFPTTAVNLRPNSSQHPSQISTLIPYFPQIQVQLTSAWSQPAFPNEFAIRQLHVAC